MNKEVIKRKTQDLKKLGQELHRPGYVMKVAKKLNAFGWFAAIGLYTLGVAALTLHFMGPPKRQGSSYQAISSLNKELGHLRAQVRDQSLLLERRDREARARVKDIRDEVVAQFNKLRTQQEEPARRAASVALKAPKAKGNVFLYSEVNKDVLQKKQEIELKRLKKSLLTKQETFLKEADLTDPAQQEAYTRLRDDAEIEIERMRSLHNEELSKFRKQRYLVMD